MVGLARENYYWKNNDGAKSKQEMNWLEWREKTAVTQGTDLQSKAE